MPCLGRVGELVEISGVGAEELSVEWRIQNVLSMPRGKEDLYDFYTSPDFRCADEPWRLRLWPNWKRETRDPSSGWLKLLLFRCNGGSTKTFYVSVSIMGSGGVEKRRVGKKNIQCYCVWKDFCSRSELMEHNTRLIPYGTLTIICSLKRVVPHAARSVLSHASIQAHSVIRQPVTPTNISLSSNQQGVSSSASIQNDSESRENVASQVLFELSSIFKNYQELSSSQSLDQQGQQPSDPCIICYEESVNCAFIPCGHMSWCYKCALKLRKSNSPCPICRKYIESILKIFMK